MTNVIDVTSRVATIVMRRVFCMWVFSSCIFVVVLYNCEECNKYCVLRYALLIFIVAYTITPYSDEDAVICFPEFSSRTVFYWFIPQAIRIRSRFKVLMIR